MNLKMRQGYKIKDTYIKAISMFEENFKLKHSFVYHLLDKHYPSCSVFALAALLLKKKSLYVLLESMFQHVVRHLCKMLNTMFQHSGAVQ